MNTIEGIARWRTERRVLFLIQFRTSSSTPSVYLRNQRNSSVSLNLKSSVFSGEVMWLVVAMVVSGQTLVYVVGNSLWMSLWKITVFPQPHPSRSVSGLSVISLRWFPLSLLCTLKSLHVHVSLNFMTRHYSRGLPLKIGFCYNVWFCIITCLHG